MTNGVTIENVCETARIFVSTNGKIYYQKKHGDSYKNPVFIGQITTNRVRNRLLSLVISTFEYKPLNTDPYTWICYSQDVKTQAFLNKYFKSLQINNQKYTLECKNQ